jgi:hypothetical protein
MAKNEHLQAFLDIIQEELDKPIEGLSSEHLRMPPGRKMPASIAIRRLVQFNRKFGNEDTWASIAALAFRQWELENYPEEHA